MPSRMPKDNKTSTQDGRFCQQCKKDKNKLDKKLCDDCEKKNTRWFGK